MAPLQADYRRTGQMRWSLTLATVLAALMLGLATNEASAQTFSVLYNFTGGADGFDPIGVTVAHSGVLYGNAQFGGAHDAGTVFKLNQVNSSWIFSPLYEFTGAATEICHPAE
jgi:uncharacterized repeat protein (TIGR03803 family)